MIRWSSRRLVFGSMFEDWSVEHRLLPRGRVFAIASAGDTALQLASRGRDVVAVDVNPAQVEYVRERAAGAPATRGQVDRMLAFGRRAVGWRPDELARFCSTDDIGEQSRRWAELDTRRFRLVTAAALQPATLRRVYAPDLAAWVRRRFDRVLRRRLARGFGQHANADNPYAALLLLGEAPPVPAATLEVAVADAADHLERAPARSFDGFALSNVLDGASAAYTRRLLAAVARAAAPGAVAVVRTFAEPAAAAEDAAAAADRALLWGAVRVWRL